MGNIKKIGNWIFQKDLKFYQKKYLRVRKIFKLHIFLFGGLWNVLLMKLCLIIQVLMKYVLILCVRRVKIDEVSKNR